MCKCELIQVASDSVQWSVVDDTGTIRPAELLSYSQRLSAPWS